MLQFTNCKRSSLFQPVSLPQVAKALEPIATALDIKTVTLTGGVDSDNQQQQLLEKPQLVIATPPPTCHYSREQASVNPMRVLGSDEQTVYSTWGFGRIFKPLFLALPKKHQILLFSATLPKELISQAEALLTNPVKVTTHQENSVVSAIEETLYLVNKGSKTSSAIALLNQHQWPQVLVFISAKDNADALAKRLNKAKISALGTQQSQEERTQALESQNGETRVLIATDVMARGIHIDQLPAVINFDHLTLRLTYTVLKHSQSRKH